MVQIFNTTIINCWVEKGYLLIIAAVTTKNYTSHNKAHTAAA